MADARVAAHLKGKSVPVPNCFGMEPNRDPLHGVTLERMLRELVEHYGWETMGAHIRIRCFTTDPSIGSSLAFLRRTPWAREKVENLYRRMLREKARETR